MRVWLETAYDQGIALQRLREMAALDTFGAHEIVHDRERAEIVLFVENGEPNDPFYTRLARHPLVQRERERVYMYNEWDFPFLLLPGLYASMPARAFDPRRQAACAYLFKPNEFIGSIHASQAEPRFLFSFAGARNHRVRHRVLALRDPRGHIEDTHAFSLWTKHAPEEALRRKRTYAEVIEQSKFVLCPRGAGTSSYRLFETLEAGRAPVVISDDWVPTTGPDWSFLLRVPERDVAQLPDLLRRYEREAADRGRAARKVWEAWFAPHVVFHRMMEALATLHTQGASRPRLRDRLPDPELARLRLEFALRGGARRLRDRARAVRASLRERA